MGLLQYLGWSASLTPWVSTTNLGEAFANLRQRNQFATLINIGLLAVLWWTISRHAYAKTKTWAWGLILVTVALALGNASSLSRTGLLQMGLICWMTWWWQRESRSSSSRLVCRLLLLTAVSYLVATLVLPLLVGQFFGSGIFSRLQEGNPACSSRMVLWSNVLHLIAQKPWLGWGWEELRYAHFITLYEGPRFCEIMGNAHNLPLHLAVTLGLPIALILCGGLAWWVWRTKPWQETDPTRQLAWGVLAVIGLHSLLEYPLWYGPFQMAVGLCLWLLWPGRGRAHGGDAVVAPAAVEAQRRGWAEHGAALLAGAGLCACAYALWDYQRVSQLYLAQAQRLPAYREHTLEKVEGSWLFQDQVRFARLSMTPLSCANAQALNTLAQAVLHYSPEASVLEKLLESTLLIGHAAEAAFYTARYRAAYPQAYAGWAATKLPDLPPCFSNSMMPVMVIPRSTALHMS